MSEQMKMAMGTPVRPHHHGGPLMGVVGAAPPVAYYIWYGDWSGNSAVSILTDLA